MNCGNGLVWSGEAQVYIDSRSVAPTEQDFYNEARTLADEGRYQAALDTLAHIEYQEQARVLNLIGYNTRKLGEVLRNGPISLGEEDEPISVPDDVTLKADDELEVELKWGRGVDARKALYPLSRRVVLDALHIGIGQAEMMADLVHQYMGDDSTERFLVLDPIVEDRAAIKKYHVGQRADVGPALAGKIDARIEAE